MSSEVVRKSSVLTKGQVYNLLENFAREIRDRKTVKEIREFTDGFLLQNKPQPRGRRSTVDLAALQAVVDETAPKMTGCSASTLACMVSAKWNTMDENVKNLLDTSRIKNLVIKNKIRFPEGVVFATRPRKPAVVSE